MVDLSRSLTADLANAAVPSEDCSANVLPQTASRLPISAGEDVRDPHSNGVLNEWIIYPSLPEDPASVVNDLQNLSALVAAIDSSAAVQFDASLALDALHKQAVGRDVIRHGDDI